MKKSEVVIVVDEEEVWEGVAPRRKLKKLKIKVEEELFVGGVCSTIEVTEVERI